MLEFDVRVPILLTATQTESDGDKHTPVSLNRNCSSHQLQLNSFFLFWRSLQYSWALCNVMLKLQVASHKLKITSTKLLFFTKTQAQMVNVL